ncbi:hypothetical protein ACMA5I_14570 [Paracoccaceae bacterium GXU_MW_L88]
MSNPVFDLLGDGGHDVESLTAYALYKQHKRAWAKDFEKQHGELPKDADNAAFARVASTNDQLDRYRKDARDILIAFANETLEDARPDIEREAITVRIEKAATEAVGQNSLWKQIQFGIVASATSTIILIILAIGVQLTGVDFLEIMQKLNAN